MTRIESPVAGTVVEVHVKTGDHVDKDQHLFVVELGKTLLIVRATIAGVVQDVAVKLGDLIQRDAVAVTIK